VLVTHEPDIAAMSSRVITMRDGRVRSDVEAAQRDAGEMLLELGDAENLPDSA
jgi:putative ABC transport system ATP-binding protein